MEMIWILQVDKFCRKILESTVHNEKIIQGHVLMICHHDAVGNSFNGFKRLGSGDISPFSITKPRVFIMLFLTHSDEIYVINAKVSESSYFSINWSIVL